MKGLRAHKLRRWKHADQGWFRDLDYKCFSADEPFLNASNYHWWVLHYGPGLFTPEVVGYAGLYVDGKTAHFCRAGILPEYRGKNFQRALIRARLTWCRRNGIKKVTTYVWAKNHASAANLKHEGFKSRRNPEAEYHIYTKDLR